MLLTTLCTEILPILLVKPTGKKSAVYAVLTKTHPGMVSISTDGTFNPDNAVAFFQEGKFCYETTLPLYASYLDKELVGNQYSPTALLSSGFLSKEQFGVIAKAVSQSQADLFQAELSSDFDYTSFALAFYRGNAPALPQSQTVTIDAESIE